MSKIPVNLAFDFIILNDVQQCLEYLALWNCKFGCIQLFVNDKIVSLDTILYQDLLCKVIAKLPQVDCADYQLQKNMENIFSQQLITLFNFNIKMFLIDFKLSNSYFNMK